MNSSQLPLGTTAWLNRAYRWLSKTERPFSLDELMILANPTKPLTGLAEVVPEIDDRFLITEDGLWHSVSLEKWRFNSLLEETEFVIVDLEATGSVFGRDEIFEIGAVKMYGSQVAEEFHTYVTVNQKIPRFVADMTKADLGLIAKAPKIEVVLGEFLQFVGSAVLVAHNAEFDYNFIYYEAQKHKLKVSPVIDICTWLLAKQVISGRKKYGLTDLAQFHKGDVKKHHSALSDAKMAGGLLKYLIYELKKLGCSDLLQMFELEKQAFKLSYRPTRRIHKRKLKYNRQF